MKEELFEKYSVPKAVMTLAMPTILGMLVTVFYNMADTFFVGKTNDPNQMASVVLVFPVFMMLMAFGNIFGIGGGTYISRLLGLKEYEKVKNVSSFCFFACIVVGIIIGILLLLFIGGILFLSGSTDNTYGFARSYMFIIAIGTPFICLQQALGQIVRAEGAARSSMIGMMIGTIVNIILDPVMILGMGMGVVGAAVATIIGNICAVAYFIYYLTKRTTVLSISIKKFKMTWDIIFNILVIGIPVFVNNILFSVANLILNNFVSEYGEIVVSAIGISHRINSLPVMTMIGLSQGIQPFVGYNYSAKNYKRMNDAIKFSSAFSVICGTIITVAFFFAAEPLVRIFIKNSEIIEMGAMFLKIFIIPIPILGIQFIFMNTFQAIGKAVPALVLSICRQGVAFIPALIIGKKLFELYGVIWALPVADLITIAISIVLYIIIYGLIKREVSMKEELLAVS